MQFRTALMNGRTAAILAVAALLCACAGDGEGLDENGRPVGEADGPLVAELASIQRHVFTPLCTGCHAGGAAPLGLRLDEGAAFSMLVGVPSVEVPTLARVQPGDPDASYLIRKLEGTASVGERMPLDAPPLPPDVIAVIRQWIVDGAQPSTATASSGAPTLDAVWPVADSIPHAAAREIVLAASAELDATLLQAGTVVLTRAGDANSGPVGIDIRLRSLAPTVFVIAPATRDWIPGRYELRVSGSAPLALADLAGRPIDGDGNGAPGGDFVLRFTVEKTP
jgi:hypothetical protein